MTQRAKSTRNRPYGVSTLRIRGVFETGARKFEATSGGVRGVYASGARKLGATSGGVRGMRQLSASHCPRTDHLLERLSRDHAVLAEFHAPEAPDAKPMPHRRARNPRLLSYLIDTKEPNIVRAVHSAIYRPEPAHPASRTKGAPLFPGRLVTNSDGYCRA